MTDKPIDLTKVETDPPQQRQNTVKTPADLEPLIEAGMRRTGKTRHGYLLAAIKFVASKETPRDACLCHDRKGRVVNVNLSPEKCPNHNE